MPRRFTRSLMLFSALLMFSFGAALTFAPQEIIHRLSAAQAPQLTILAQAGGALYLGFAMLNWMAKDTLLGGIYNRPIVMGNFLHFFTLAMALLKTFPLLPRTPGPIALVIIYPVLAAAFASLLFRHPRPD